MNKEDQSSPGAEALLQSTAKVSKVSSQKKRTLTHLYWLGGGVLVIGLVWACSIHHPKQKMTATQTQFDSPYSTSLAANLARLRSMEESTVHPSSDHLAMPRKQVSKAYLARQNAPTMMYSDANTHSLQRTVQRAVHVATFSGHGANQQFANTQTITTTVQAKKLTHPNFTIASGEFLQAVLETAINSDLPGMIRAVVSRPVYSYTGERVLIPAGSRLIGQYSSAVLQGQDRVMVVWNRVILPNGVTVQVNSPGTDALGRAGLGADSVNTHFFARFGESALLSLIGAGAATLGVEGQENNNSVAQYRSAIAHAFQQSANRSLQGTLPIKPTLHVYQGARITVFVAHDLSFYQVDKQRADLSPPATTLIPYR